VPATVADSSPAYVLFTSGSTGKPKGCCVPHRGSAIYGQAVAKVCNTSDSMNFLLKTPYVFDVHIQDIYSAFAIGATLVVAEPGVHKDAGAIAETIAQECVNVCCFVPTILVEFVNHLKSHPASVKAVAPHLTRVLCIGEALMTATCQELVELIPAVQIHNLYGPTEASVGVSHFLVDIKTLPSVLPAPVVPIGKPFPYVSFRAMDHAQYDGKDIQAALLKDVTDGEIGELFIGGDCLAHGYINDEAKTAAAFFDFPAVQPRPPNAASKYSLYKTGDLVRRRADGVFEYMGRCDFQVKIGGVRIECDEVSSVLKTHPAVKDALVTAFDGPFGKALAAYIVADPNTEWQRYRSIAGGDAEDGADDEDKDLVSKWGAVYDEMYQDSGEGVSEGDPTLNWSGYIDTYSRRTHIELVIKEWVEWSCDLVLRHRDECFPAASSGGPSAAGGRERLVVELGCGNGMLLFRIAPVVAKALNGRYIGTDISTSGLSYVKGIMARGPPYGGLPIETQKIAAHEILNITKEASVDVVLCNGVTMYFPSTAYLIECMQTAVKATIDGGFSIFGDIQSKRHLMAFHADVQTFQALRRPNATPLAVLRAAQKAASTEQLSYFDDSLFHRLDQAGSDFFEGRVARFEMRLKRGYWHSEFNRFRYDIELVVGPKAASTAPLKFKRCSHEDLCAFLSKPCVDEISHVGAEVCKFVGAQVEGLPDDIDGLVVTLPNARVLRPVRLLAWLEEASKEGKMLTELPAWLRPEDMELGGPEGESVIYGVEPEALFEMQLPAGWTQRVIWAEDPAMLELVVIRHEASLRPWLGALASGAAAAATCPSEEELAAFKNNQSDYQEATAQDSQKACHDALRDWALDSPLLPAMRPLVYVALEEFPKNQAGKTDRGKLPDARGVLDKVSDAAALAFEAPHSEEEAKMAKLWEEVVKGPVGASTPFIAYGVNSLVALSLSAKILDALGKRPDLAFMMSEDCTVAALVRQLKAEDAADGPGDASGQRAQRAILRLSPDNRRGIHMLIVGAAGTSAATYRSIVEHFVTMQVYAAEYPGRGERAAEPLETDIEAVLAGIESQVEAWAKGKSFIIWGDSLGAVIAYELIVRLARKPAFAGILGLCVSGNAGPTLAVKERGMGESVKEYLGREVNSVAEMTDKDWDRFFLAANSEDSAQLEALIANPEMRKQVMGPLVADCTVYESYSTCRGRHVRCPILTIRGSKDQITAASAMNSWKEVSGAHCAHRAIQGVGHMIVKEAPHQVARVLEEHFLPDFTQHLHEYRGFRAAYERLRRRGAAAKPMFSPTLGVTGVPKDEEEAVVDFTLEGLDLGASITPMTKQMKQMRVGNAQWRLGQHKGNPLRNPH